MTEPAVAIPARPDRRWRAWAGLAIVLVGLLLVRLPRAGVPLERDEGEYAYAGQLLLAGVPPYRLAYNMKFPGTYAAYAVMMSVFGRTPAGIHRGTTAVVAADVVLTFLLARRWPGGGGGTVAAATLAVLASNPLALGLAGHATHFVMLFAVAGLVVLSPRGPTAARTPLRCGVAGALLAIAALMKQQGAAFAPLAAAVVLFDGRGQPWRRRAAQLATLVAGSAVPMVVTAGLLAWAGVLGRGWHWTVEYAWYYGRQSTPELAWDNLTYGLWRVTTFTAPLWWIAVAGLPAGWWRRPGRPGAAFRLGFAAAGAVAASAGLYFREHYFVLLMPAAALLAGAAVAGVADLVGRPGSVAHGLPGVGFAVACAASLWAARPLWAMSPDELSRAIYGSNPFTEAPVVADYLRQHTVARQTVAVIGSEPELFVLAGRRSATGYIYAYPLMEDQPFAAAMQREMAAEVEAARPAYVVVVRNRASWLDRPTSDRWVFGWAERLVAGDRLVGVVDMTVWPSRFYWDAAAPAGLRALAGRSPSLLIYRTSAVGR